LTPLIQSTLQLNIINYISRWVPLQLSVIGLSDKLLKYILYLMKTA
jgi:hypothetical protein